MKNHTSKLSLIFFGFIGGIAFLISCGGSGSSSVGLPINDADADVPVISDQMFCIGGINSVIDENATNQISCMKQSTKVKETYNNLSGPYSEGWILISNTTYGSVAANMTYLFYK